MDEYFTSLERENAFKNAANSNEFGGYLRTSNRRGYLTALFCIAHEESSSLEFAFDKIINPFDQFVEQETGEALSIKDLMSFNTYGCRPIQMINNETHFPRFSKFEIMVEFLKRKNEEFSAEQLLLPTFDLNKADIINPENGRYVRFQENSNSYRTSKEVFDYHSNKISSHPTITYLSIRGFDRDSNNWLHHGNSETSTIQLDKQNRGFFNWLDYFQQQGFTANDWNPILHYFHNNKDNLNTEVIEKCISYIEGLSTSEHTTNKVVPLFPDAPQA